MLHKLGTPIVEPSHYAWQNTSLCLLHLEWQITRKQCLSSPNITALLDMLLQPSMMSTQAATKHRMQDKAVASIAAKHGKTVAQTLLQWGLQHGTSVITKSTNPKHSQVIDCCKACS